MKSDLQKNTRDVDVREPTPEGVFKALSDEYRQHILTYLVNRSETVTLHDLADYITSNEYEPTSAGTRSALLALQHIHLPHLAAAGLVRYDTADGIVALRVDAADIRPFLDLTTATIRRHPEYH